jgi:hypothetical protein
MTIKTAIAALLALAQTTATTPAVDYSIAPIAAGSWSYVAVPGGSEARFTDATATIRLTIHCTKATRRVSISHASAAPASSMFVWTSSATRTLPAVFDPKGMRVTADLAASDPLLDAIAFSRGRVAVSLPGMSALVVPAWVDPARAVEDCRI